MSTPSVSTWTTQELPLVIMQRTRNQNEVVTSQLLTVHTLQEQSQSQPAKVRSNTALISDEETEERRAPWGVITTKPRLVPDLSSDSLWSSCRANSLSRHFFHNCFQQTYFIRMSVTPAVGARTPILRSSTPLHQNCMLSSQVPRLAT